MTAQLPSERIPAAVAGSPGSLGKAGTETKPNWMSSHRSCSSLLLAQLPLLAATPSSWQQLPSEGGRLSDELLASICLGCQQCSLGNPHARTFLCAPSQRPRGKDS